MKIDQTYSIKTFGCKVNTYDSALIQKNLSQAGFDLQPKRKTDLSAPEVHIINTCAVTDEAVKEALRYIRRYKAKHSQSRIVVTGCASQVETEKFAHLKEVDLVVANSHKAELANILNKTCSGQVLPFEKGAALEVFPSYNKDLKHEKSNKTSINQPARKVGSQTDRQGSQTDRQGSQTDRQPPHFLLKCLSPLSLKKPT